VAVNFKVARASWLDKFQARVRSWISSHLEKLFGRMGISASVGNAIAWTLVTLLGLLLAFWAVRSVMNAAARSEMDLRGAVPAGRTGGIGPERRGRQPNAATIAQRFTLPTGLRWLSSRKINCFPRTARERPASRYGWCNEGAPRTTRWHI